MLVGKKSPVFNEVTGKLILFVYPTYFLFLLGHEEAEAVEDEELAEIRDEML